MVVTNAEGESAEGPMHINVTVSQQNILLFTFIDISLLLMFSLPGFDVWLCWTRTCVTKFEDAINQWCTMFAHWCQWCW